MTGRFIRLSETERASLTIYVDGQAIQALQGDTLMVAMLCTVSSLRESEFGDGRRAGVCLMAACQDCWVWTEEGTRLRACSTTAIEGMRVCTKQPEATWSNLT